MTDELKPTKIQQALLDAVCSLVNANLWLWGRQSGKTTFRKMLAKRILEEDNEEIPEHRREDHINPGEGY